MTARELRTDLDDLAAMLAEIDADIKAEREATERAARAEIERAEREAEAAAERDAQDRATARTIQARPVFRPPVNTEFAAPYSRVPAVPLPADQPFAEYMDEFRRMARGGVSIESIGAAFGFPPTVVAEILRLWPDVTRAHAQCAALSIGHAADQLQGLIDSGELGAITFFLKTRGGFASAAAERDTPLVNINIGSMPATVSPAHAEELLREQATLDAPLIDGVLVHEKPDPAGTGSGA